MAKREHFTNNGEFLDPKKLTKEQKETIKQIRLRTELTMSMLKMVWGHEYQFAITVFPPEVEDGARASFFTDMGCPGCAAEMIHECTQKIQHNDGRRLFETTKGEHKH